MQKCHAGKEADRLLKSFFTKYRGNFLECDLSAVSVSAQCEGHRQTTDTYLAMLAEKHSLKLATLDEPLKSRFRDFVEFVA